MTRPVFGQKPQKIVNKSYLEDRLAAYLTHKKLPKPVRQFRFHRNRQWRVDFCWPDRGLVVEVEGGTYIKGGGGHNTGQGFADDCVKYNTLALEGYVLLRFPVDAFKDGSVYTVVEEALARKDFKYYPSVLVDVG